MTAFESLRSVGIVRVVLLLCLLTWLYLIDLATSGVLLSFVIVGISYQKGGKINNRSIRAIVSHCMYIDRDRLTGDQGWFRYLAHPAQPI